MSKGCFSVYKNPQNENDIVVAVLTGTNEGDIPSNQVELYVKIESTNTIIQSLRNTNQGIKTKYFDKLLSLAQVGLVGVNGEVQPELAEISLISLKKEIITNEGARIKNKYMIDLGIGAIIGVLGVMLGLTYIYSNINNYNIYITPYLFCFLGAMIGTWISFGARKVELEFEELNIIEKDRVNPYLRLIFVGISSMIFLLFFNSEVFELTIGSFSTVDLKSSIELQILVGIISGLLEYKLAIGLFDKASSIVKFK